jgi:hypothetical protein
MPAALELAGRCPFRNGGASGESAQDPAPETEISIQRRRRTGDRSLDVERSDMRPPYRAAENAVSPDLPMLLGTSSDAINCSVVPGSLPKTRMD